MTEAIRTGSFTNGFAQGAEMVDRHVDRRERRENQREAIALQKDDREFNRTRMAAADERADKSLAIQESNSSFNQNRLASEDQRSRQKHGWEQDKQYRQKRDTELKALSEEAGQYFHLFEQGSFESLDPQRLLAFHEKAVAARRPTLSPLSWDNETVSRVKRVGPLLQQLEQGNLEYVNAPGNLKILSELPGWSDKLNVGIGEAGRNGSPIAKKELAELKTAGDGRVVPMLRVTTEDGESYVSEMSAFRGTDPNEPVIAADAGQLIENAMGQYMLANLFSSEQAQQQISQVRGQLFGSQKKNDLSSTGKTIRDLMAFGVSQDEAIQLSTQSKQDPQKAVLSLTNAIMKGGLVEDASEAMQQAKEALGVNVAAPTPQADPSTGAPAEANQAEAMFNTLRQNPNNKQYSDEQLRAAIRQKLEA